MLTKVVLMVLTWGRRMNLYLACLEQLVLTVVVGVAVLLFAMRLVSRDL